MSDKISVPHPHDVLSGRGKIINDHPGNQYFRSLVKVYKPEYVMACRDDKPLFSKLIYNSIQGLNPPGRFLMKEGKEATLWTDMGERKSLDKTRQSLREDAKEFAEEVKAGKIKINTNVVQSFYVHGNGHANVNQKIHIPSFSSNGTEVKQNNTNLSNDDMSTATTDVTMNISQSQFNSFTSNQRYSIKRIYGSFLSTLENIVDGEFEDELDYDENEISNIEPLPIASGHSNDDLNRIPDIQPLPITSEQTDGLTKSFTQKLTQILHDSGEDDDYKNIDNVNNLQPDPIAIGHISCNTPDDDAKISTIQTSYKIKNDLDNHQNYEKSDCHDETNASLYNIARKGYFHDLNGNPTNLRNSWLKEPQNQQQHRMSLSRNSLYHPDLKYVHIESSRTSITAVDIFDTLKGEHTSLVSDDNMMTSLSSKFSCASLHDVSMQSLNMANVPADAALGARLNSNDETDQVD